MLWNGYPIARRAWRVWRNERRLNIDFSTRWRSPHRCCRAIRWPAHRHLADQTRRLDPRSDRGGLRRAISELLEFQAKTAWVLRDGVVELDTGHDLAVGDLVVVYPGDMISVDGEIVDGHATIDQKTITGEGLPVIRGIGEPAFAATVIRDGQLTIRAIRVGSATTAGQIAHLSIPRRSATPACRTTPKSSPTGWSRRRWGLRSAQRR